MVENIIIVVLAYFLLVCLNGLRENGNIKWLYYASQILLVGFVIIAIMAISAMKDANKTIQELRNMPECYEVVVD